MNPVVHFEFPYEEQERIARFYEQAFGWRSEALGEAMGNYVLATTTESDESGPKRPGAINGGFFPKKPDRPAQHPSVVIAVDDIKASMERVRRAGGTVLPSECPRRSTMAVVITNRSNALHVKLNGAATRAPAAIPKNHTDCNGE